MKKIFLSIGLAALMLVSGTNYYIASNTSTNYSLNLDDVEANADGNSEAAVPPWLGPLAQVVGIIGGLTTVGYLIYDHYKDHSSALKNDLKTQPVTRRSDNCAGTHVYCTGSGSVCDAISFPNVVQWNDGSTTNY